MMFTLTPLMDWYEPDSWFPDRHVVQLPDGQMLDVPDRRIDGNYFTLQYLRDVALNDPGAVRLRAEAILAVYTGPTAEEKACTTVELLAAEWCENGLRNWRAATFSAKRNDDADWQIIEGWVQRRF